MKDNNLLASVALFSELYNNEGYSNVTDILGEFIKGVVVTENKWTVNSTELKHLLETVYEFKIPESVIRTTVKNRLRDIATIQTGHYVFSQSIKDNFVRINQAYSSIQEKQNRIISKLVKFIEQKEGIVISETEKHVVVTNLTKYLLDNGVNEKYSKYISAFVISNQDELDFTANLNLIREGIILYQGIRYTADINELGKWNTELTIYLSTEHLFNALGFNGILFEQIFSDFYNLVSEINSSNRVKSGEKIIQLKYLEETSDEIDAFFKTAEYILRGTATLDTTRPAMKSILDGCRRASDIMAKRVKFKSDLEKKGIELKEFKTSAYQYADYVVDDENILEELRKLSESKGRPFDADQCRQFFKIFTKINYLRGGESKTKFEKIGSIFITGNSFALYLAHNSKVKFQGDDIPFAKDIDYITSKFWFKLKKGFSNKTSLPKSFDIVTKAQIIISSRLNQSVFQEYQRLQSQIKDGKLTMEEAKNLSFELRQKPNKPEEITIETIDKSLDFLTNDSYFEDLHREKVEKDKLLAETLRQNTLLQEELQKRSENDLAVKRQEATEERDKLGAKVAKEQWKLFRKAKMRDVWYSMGVILVTVLPIIIAFALKASQYLNDLLTRLGGYQYIIWATLIGVFLFEIVGRSYLFNKERVKSGWSWLMLLLRQGKFRNEKILRCAGYEKSFIEQHKINI